MPNCISSHGILGFHVGIELHSACMQGVAGSIPFQALVFFTLYFQLLGFSNFAASALMSGFLFATAFGGLLGGWIGDK